MTDLGGGLMFFGIWGGMMLLFLGGVVLAVWALIDLLNKPEWAWQYAGENRTTYIVFLALGLAMCQYLAWIPAIIYFKSAKPKVTKVMQSMPPPVMPGPYSGYGYTPYPVQPYPGQQYPGQPGAYGQPPTSAWTTPQPAPPGPGPTASPPAGYPSPGQGVPQAQLEPGTDEWWKQPGATPPQG